MFYMSYIPCEIFAYIEKFFRRSQPMTKSYARGIFRMEPVVHSSCETIRCFFWPTSCAKAVVLRMREDASCAIDCMHCMYCTRPAEMITHVSMCTTSVLHDRSTFFDVSQQCSSVFTHVFVTSSIDISTHNSEMLMSVL